MQLGRLSGDVSFVQCTHSVWCNGIIVHDDDLCHGYIAIDGKWKNTTIGNRISVVALLFLVLF